MPGKCRRGTVLDTNLDPSLGHEHRKTRPCVVIQNDVVHEVRFGKIHGQLSASTMKRIDVALRISLQL